MSDKENNHCIEKLRSIYCVNLTVPFYEAKKVNFAVPIQVLSDNDMELELGSNRHSPWSLGQVKYAWGWRAASFTIWKCWRASKCKVPVFGECQYFQIVLLKRDVPCFQ